MSRAMERAGKEGPENARAMAARPALTGAAVMPASSAAASPFAPLGPPSLDALLGGGLARAALHEIAGREAGDLPAACGFATALAVRLMRTAPGGSARLLWIADETALREDGAPYPPGLAMHGLDPARLVFVRATDSRAALWAMEQALRCRALTAVVAEIARLAGPDELTISRRLVLAAREGGAAGLLVQAAGAGDAATGAGGAGRQRRASAAKTRWCVRAAPSRPGLAGEPGHPAWHIALVRHRGGREGQWTMEWDHESGFLRERSQALSGDRPAAPAERPHPPAAAARKGR